MSFWRACLCFSKKGKFLKKQCSATKSMCKWDVTTRLGVVDHLRCVTIYYANILYGIKNLHISKLTISFEFVAEFFTGKSHFRWPWRASMTTATKTSHLKIIGEISWFFRFSPTYFNKTCYKKLNRCANESANFAL